MEKIKINSIEKKMSKNGKPFWVVKYGNADNDPGYATRDATIGAWDSQLADYLEHEVGVGGSVSVVITQKGDYTNITEVDMSSGVKGIKVDNLNNEPITQAPSMDDRTASIVAQVILKGAVELTKEITVTEDKIALIPERLCNFVNELTGAYKLALSNVKAL